MGPVRYRARYIGYSAALAVVGFLLLAAPMAAAALAAEPLAPEPLVPEPSLTVSPSPGRPTAPLAATFRIANAVRCPSTATFYWDGQQIRETGFRDRCVATAAFTPPPGDRAPGPHTVTAVAGHFSDSTTYVVDPVPSPTFSPKPTPSPTTVAPTTAAPTPGRTRSTPTPEASVASPAPSWCSWAPRPWCCCSSGHGRRRPTPTRRRWSSPGSPTRGVPPPGSGSRRALQPAVAAPDGSPDRAGSPASTGGRPAPGFRCLPPRPAGPAPGRSGRRRRRPRSAARRP